MSRDPYDRYLLPDEFVAVRLSYHWMFLAKPTLILVGAMAATILLLDVFGSSAATVLIAVIGLGAALTNLAGAWESLHAARFIVTENRAIFVSGWLSRRYGMMPLSKITDLTIEQSIAGRVCGYGSLVAESAGQDQALSRIDFLPNPEEVWQIMSDLFYMQEAVRSGYKMRAQRGAPPPPGWHNTSPIVLPDEDGGD